MDRYDRYSQEIELVSKALAAGESINPYWGHDTGKHAHLFDGCRNYRLSCFCPINIRCSGGPYPANSLEERIRTDKRIPKHELEITAKHLPAFADIQRMVDKELGRTPPPLLEVT
jgi:hypothetical protein